LLRAAGGGIATCAIDLPGHGERPDPSLQARERTLDLLEAALADVDRAADALADPAWGGVFDLDRLALGGMSAGGMVTLRRLGEEHPFVCAAVESTAGSLAAMYPRADPARRARVDPEAHLDGWRPIPLLALHSLADAVVPVAAVTGFLDALGEQYAARGADARLIELRTWPATGAPDEHSGFGRVAGEAKAVFVDFLERHLVAGARGGGRPVHPGGGGGR
jgi:fermentation-respiration switch protein FrsA (DUF1100 family)